MTDDLYLQYLQTPPASSSKPKPPAQAAIPDDILPFAQPRPQPAPKPVEYDPLSSIQAPKPKPTPKPQEPTVPLVVFTTFDADTAEELAKRLQNTARPQNDLPMPSPSQPLPTYQSGIADYEARQEERLGIHSPAHDRGQTPADLPTPEPTAHDLEFAWSSEAPFLSLDAAEMSDYFSALENDLVREVSISLQLEKFILDYLEDPLEYLKHFATYTWDEESDAAAEEFIRWYVERFRSELEQQRERAWSLDALSDIEYWIREVANDERESVIVYDLEAGEVLFARYGDRDSVTMQTLHQKLAEGREIFLIHNHPNNSGASPADLSAAAWLDAEYLIIVNPDGTLHRHQKVGDALVELEPVQNRDYIAPVDPLETVAHSIAYWIQSLREIGNPPEMVMRQGEADFTTNILEFARRLGKDADLETLSETQLLQVIFEGDMSTFEMLESLRVTGAVEREQLKEYITGLQRALYIREAAEHIGVNPAALAMVQLWEDAAMHSNPVTSLVEHGSYWWAYNTNVLPGKEKSFGVSQVQIPVAIAMLNQHPEWFDDLNLPRERMQEVWDSHELQDGWSNYDVGYQLYMNEEFNIRVAGAYLTHLKSWLEEEHLPPLGVAIADEQIETAHISTGDLWKLAIVGYNQGTGAALARLQDRYDSGGAIAVGEKVKDMLGNLRDIFGAEHKMPSMSELADLEAGLATFLEELPDLVSGTDVAAPNISGANRRMLAIAAHNRGWDHTLAELEDTFRRGGPSNVVEGIKNTLEIPYVSNVFSLADEALTKYGLSYGEDQKQE